MTENNTNDADKFISNLEDYYIKAEYCSLIPLLKLIYITSNNEIDLYNDFKNQCTHSIAHDINLSNEKDKLIYGDIVLESKNNKKFRVFIDIVDDDYDLNSDLINAQILSPNITSIMDETDEELKNLLIYVISMLINYIKTVFNNYLKNKYKELIEYDIIVDHNTTVYIDYNKKKRLGIKFQKI